MEKQLIVQILVWICGVGVIVAGILYFVSFDSFMKDVERRLDEVKKKRR